jgi:hypothetical protein
MVNRPRLSDYHGMGVATEPLRVRILGRSSSPLGYMIRYFQHRSDVPFEWVELDNDERAPAEAGVSNVRDSRLPVCVFRDGSRLERPTIRQIVEETRLVPRPVPHRIRSGDLWRGARRLERRGLRRVAEDVRRGSVKRCASAVGEGAMAVTLVHRYLAGN